MVRAHRQRAIGQRLFWRKIRWSLLQKLAACGTFLLFSVHCCAFVLCESEVPRTQAIASRWRCRIDSRGRSIRTDYIGNGRSAHGAFLISPKAIAQYSFEYFAGAA